MTLLGDAFSHNLLRIWVKVGGCILLRNLLQWVPLQPPPGEPPEEKQYDGYSFICFGFPSFLAQHSPTVTALFVLSIIGPSVRGL